MKATTRSSLVLLALATAAIGQQPAATTPPVSIAQPPASPAPAVEKPAETPAEKPVESAEKPAEKPAPDPVKVEQEKLTADNNLAAEKLKAETNAIRAEITRLKMEKELLGEKLALEAVKRQAAQEESLSKVEDERAKLARDNELAKAKAEYLTNEMKAVQSESTIAILKLQNQISSIEM